jgi:thiamine pyrophosphate-dependent acetolactate synthase large subunit-like protein
MIRYECFEWLAPLITDQIIVTSLSGQRVEWGQLSQHEGNLLLGSMGNALAVGTGLALALPHRKVIVFESDGSLLLSLFNLPTVANLGPQNLAVFVFDNHANQRTHGHCRKDQPRTDRQRIRHRRCNHGAGYRTVQENGSLRAHWARPQIHRCKS